MVNSGSFITMFNSRYLPHLKGTSKNSNSARTGHHNSLTFMTIIFLQNVGNRIFRGVLKMTWKNMTHHEIQCFRNWLLTFNVIARIHRKSIHQLLLTLFFSIAMPMETQAAFTASVSQTSLAGHETIELTLHTDEKSSNAPDLKPLEWSFVILGTRQHSQTSIINGNSKFTRDWVVTLAPKQQGTLIIPPIKLGDQQTAPITITVSDKKADYSSDDIGPILMKSKVSSESVYVQQELIFTLQILFSIQLYDDNRLSAMDISDALIQQLGETRNLDTTIDGIRYRGFELKYSIHPQSAGEMIIPSLTFTGIATASRDPFGSFFSSGGKPVIARSPEIKIEVKPRPENYPTDETWLPARNLSIEEKWSQPLDSLKVGDAITRTITVVADGLSAAQIPTVLITQPEGVNSYPDKSSTEDRKTVNGVQGQHTDSIAMIPTRPGKITLPAIEYVWFDTKSGEIKTSRLPETEIDVKAEPNTNAFTQPVIASHSANKTVECQAPSSSAPDTTTDLGSTQFWRTPVFWQCSTIIFALLWLVTLGLWRFKTNSIRTIQQTSKTDNLHQPSGYSSEAEAFSQLEAACHQEDIRLTLSELKNWCRLRLNNEQLNSLTDCINQLGSEELNSICNQLSARLYGSQTGEADTKELLATLLKICSKLRGQSSDRKRDQQLDRLYPE